MRTPQQQVLGIDQEIDGLELELDDFRKKYQIQKARYKARIYELERSKEYLLRLVSTPNPTGSNEHVIRSFNEQRQRGDPE